MGRRDPKLEMLHAIPLFAKLGDRDLERVGQLADEVDLPAGRVLMRQGESGSEMFIIARGAVVVERDGREIAVRGPGEVFGEIALLSEGPRTATVTCTEPSTLLVLAHREFHTLMDETPGVRAAVLDELARRLRAVEIDRAH
ncbi:MAG TPA: cyclic nucleotide-binding domain-containing protein [Candidatus Limnocylindria bacterium]|nr:cyclic nucleotide-binding domain-containing protein [Candidatus Limnocylindria bacterium]